MPIQRPFLDAAALRTLGPSINYLVFQTNDKSVAESQSLRGTQTTNPHLPEDTVCFFNCFRPNNYGRYHVIFEKGALMAYPAAPPEYRVHGTVEEQGLGYTTTEELLRAGRVDKLYG